MKKLSALCLMLSFVAVLISSCEQTHNFSTSSYLTNTESGVATSQGKNSTSKSPKNANSLTNSVSSAVSVILPEDISNSKSSKNNIERTSSVSSAISSKGNSSITSSSKEQLNELVVFVSSNHSNKKEISGIKTVPYDVKYTEVKHTVYDNETLNNIFPLDKNLTVEKLNLSFPIEYMKVYDNACTVFYFSDQKTLKFVFNEDGTELKGRQLHTLCKNNEDFFKLTKDNVQEDVMKIDPDYDNYSNYIGSGDFFPVRSWHFTKDGYHIAITYETPTEYQAPIYQQKDEYRKKYNYIKKIEVEIF